MNYQAVVFISDAEDALEAAKLLSPLNGVEKVKVATIAPRPEARPVAPPTKTAEPKDPLPPRRP